MKLPMKLVFLFLNTHQPNYTEDIYEYIVFSVEELLLKLLEDVHEAGTNFETPRFK